MPKKGSKRKKGGKRQEAKKAPPQTEKEVPVVETKATSPSAKEVKEVKPTESKKEAVKETKNRDEPEPAPAATAEEEFTDVVSDFNSKLKQNPTMAVAVAAMQAMTSVVRRSTASTIYGLETELKCAHDELVASNKSSISLAAGSVLFQRHVTRTFLDIPDEDFSKMKARLLERGKWFTEMSMTSRKRIADLFNRFLHSGQTLLVHGFSRVVLNCLRYAASRGKFFKIIVTESRPECAGYLLAEELKKEGIPCTIILDSAMGYVMEKVDFIVVGAEGVAESGGIINKIGTYQLAITAKAFNRPVYVCAESYKFARLFPLNQSDLPESLEDHANFQPLQAAKYTMPIDTDTLNPGSDYTPPNYITLLFTDLGILTPSAVSDELIKLHS